MAAISWRKLGCVFTATGQFGWMKSHAQVPTPWRTEHGLRVYFATRPRPDLSLTTFLDIDLPSLAIRYVHDRPLLEPGPPGTFDEHGIMPSAAVEGDDGRLYLYYSGWSRSTQVPYVNTTGLAVSDDGGHSFRRVFAGPVLGRGPYEPYSATSPCLLRDDGGGWHMWYCSGTGWHRVAGKYEPVYAIKHAASADGLHWQPDKGPCIPPRHPREASTRPTVIRLNGRWHMWFCCRESEDFRNGAGSYRLGYAWSEDGRTWQRDDEAAGLPPSPEGWDSRMVAYPSVIETSAGLMMFYNGNGFGASGMGVALGTVTG